MSKKAFDGFAVLGQPVEATPAELKQAWRDWAAENHPDKGGDTARFQAVSGLYQEALKYAQQPRICKACGGCGFIPLKRGFGSEDCGPCEGTGKVSLQ